MASPRPLGSLQQAILLILWSDEHYGLEIQRRLKYQGKTVGPGQLYPALRRLEEQGYISSREVSRVGANRVYYQITEDGKSVFVDTLMEVLYSFRHISMNYLSPFLMEAVEKAGIQAGSTILDLSSPLMEKIRMKAIQLNQPEGKYILVNTVPEYSDSLEEWISSEELESVLLIDREAVDGLQDLSFDTVLILYNIFELNEDWTLSNALRLLKKGGKLVICDIEAREADTIRDDLYKEYMPTYSKSGISEEIKDELEKRGMKTLVFEKNRGLITGIFQKK